MFMFSKENSMSIVKEIIHPDFQMWNIENSIFQTELASRFSYACEPLDQRLSAAYLAPV